MSTAWYQQQDAPARSREYVASKVPVITGLFWVIKILTTGMGETTSDYLVHTYNPYLAVFAGAICFAIVMAAQLLTKRYVTWIYWLAVVMVSVFGTMCADVTHIVFGVPYAVSTAAFVVILAAVFTLWYRTEGTLSIHSIYTPRRELFYWATVLATFALGTAAGDMTARTLHLGFLSSGIMFAVVFAIPAIGNWKLGMNPVLAFWFAYIVTRPLGASFADWLAIRPSLGGLGLGDGLISGVLTVLIVILVAVLAVTGLDVEERGRARSVASQGPGQGRGGRHRSPAGAAGAAPAWSGASASPPPGQEYGQGEPHRAAAAPAYWQADQAGYGPGDPHGYPPAPQARYGPAGQGYPGRPAGGQVGPDPSPGPGYGAGPRPAGPPRSPQDPYPYYGPADQTRRLARPDGPGQPPPATQPPPFDPRWSGQPPLEPGRSGGPGQPPAGPGTYGGSGTPPDRHVRIWAAAGPGTYGGSGQPPAGPGTYGGSGQPPSRSSWPSGPRQVPPGPGRPQGAQGGPGGPRRYGPGDRTRPLDRRDPQRGAAPPGQPGRPAAGGFPPA